MLSSELKAFYMVARLGSITLAAKKLGLSQPTVTTQIRNLEAQYGVELFFRGGRRLTLSDDGTRERLSAWCAQDARFHMIDNPGRIVSCGLNRCIEASHGEFIVRLDVHTVYAPDYISRCLAVWQETGADNVGGPWRAQGESGPAAGVQRAVAAAAQLLQVEAGLARDGEKGPGQQHAEDQRRGEKKCQRGAA